MLWITGDRGPVTGDGPAPAPGVRPDLWILGTKR